jgi:SAM-dependent methyltransferase
MLQARQQETNLLQDADGRANDAVLELTKDAGVSMKYLKKLKFRRFLRKAVGLSKADASSKEFNAIKWYVKQNGYNLSRSVFELIKTLPTVKDPVQAELKSKCSTQDDIESDWFRYWMAELRLAPLPHRKLWEFAFVLQNLYQSGFLKPGLSGIGFGCGEEPLPSYFASRGIRVTVTDLHPEAVAGLGWAESGQHASSLMSSFSEKIIDRSEFERLVSLRYVDMNDIPRDLNQDFDFCWSVCALEHLGSIQNGMNFIHNSLSVLKPGGLALHTTEFNYSETDLTIEGGPTVLFLRKHFELLAEQLTEAGHFVMPLDFSVGDKPLDAFVDLPPYGTQPFSTRASEGDDEFRPGHLKLSVGGFPSTCFGIVIRKQ